MIYDWLVSGEHLSAAGQWIRIYLSVMIAGILRWGKNKTVDDRQYVEKKKTEIYWEWKSSNRHRWVRTEGGLGEMLKWRCDRCFRTLGLLHSPSEPPPCVLVLFSLPCCPSPGQTSAMISAATRLYLILPLSGCLLTPPPSCTAHVHVPKAHYIAHERKELSIPKCQDNGQDSTGVKADLNPR